MSEGAPPGSTEPESPQQAWQLPPPPGYWAGYPPATDNQAIAALVCAVLALPVGFFCYGVPGIALGLVGFFLGRSSEKRIRQSQGRLTGLGMARGAWITGIVAAAVSTVVLLAMVALMAVLFSSFGHRPFVTPSPT